MPDSAHFRQRSPEDTQREVLYALHRGGPQTIGGLVGQVSDRHFKRGRDAIASALEALEAHDPPLVRLGSGPEAFDLPDHPRGRPGRWAHLSPSWGRAVGIEVGALAIRVGLADIDGRLLQQSKRSHDVRNARHDETLTSIAEMVTMVAAAERRTADGHREVPIVGITLALPAPVNQREGSVSTDVLDGWVGNVGHKLAALLPDELADIPIRLANDANARALGELFYGAARGASDALIVKASGAVGCGIIEDGHVIEGSHGAAGEFGHMTVDPHRVAAAPITLQLPALDPQAMCACKRRGHLQCYASAMAITDRWLATPDGASFAPRSKVPGHYAANFALLAQGWNEDEHSATFWVVRQAVEVLGQAIANVVLLLDPTVIVITGRLATLGPGPLVWITEALLNLKPRSGALPRVVLGSSGEDGQPWIGVKGAARAAFQYEISPVDPPET